MTKYTVTFNIERIEYSSATKVIEARSLEEAEKKAQRLADDDDFFDKIDDEDPDDSYANIGIGIIQQHL